MNTTKANPASAIRALAASVLLAAGAANAEATRVFVTPDGGFAGADNGSTEVVIEGCKLDRNAITNTPNDIGQGFG